jgi:hypothetical protein
MFPSVTQADDATSTFTLTAGELTLLSIPGNFDYGTGTIGSTSSGSASIANQAFSVRDARGGDGVWYLTATRTELMQTSKTLPVTNMTMTVTPGTAGTTGVSNGVIPLTGGLVIFSGSNALGTSVSGSGSTSSITFGDTSGLPSGAYTGTITFTLNDSV